ncbi:MAG TPA: sigma-70 family RNA polymerase sigma factor [Vicinamibacteria bacterium]|nr:sigma-70 family RNA polymerase sigma factor [Vicinamibacteria bacterium]
MAEPLRPEQFETLLQRLGPDREAAATRYEQLRRRLIAVFEYRRCHHAEELADETLDRVARKLQELRDEFTGSDPSRYVFGVAWNVARESYRRPATLPLPETWERPASAAKEEDDELENACLDRCLEKLDAGDKRLALEYHEGQGGAKIRLRSELARELGLSQNALRLKIHRVTARLRECVLQCVDRSRETDLTGALRGV